MKQLRWVWILGITAVLLAGLFFLVDHHTRKKEEQAAIGGPKQLFSFDGNDIRHMTVKNEEGSFDFEWNNSELTWKLISDEPFDINAYAVAAIANYFSALKAQKTVAFDCQDTAAYGFDNPVTVMVYTTETGDENPYILYVGDNTPTYDAYYAMVGGSDDVYTIDYTSGSIFCAAKDTLKNMYIFDTTASLISYIKVECGGKTTMEMERDSDYVWTLHQPEGFKLLNSAMDILTDNITRITVSAYVEEKPEDLAKYGLDHPHTKVWLRGNVNNAAKSREIWLGNPVSDHEDETEIYGYFVEEQQVFKIKRAEMSFTESNVKAYLNPYCIDINMPDVAKIEIDMGEIYDLHETLTLDYATRQYSIGDIDITARNDDNLMAKYSAFCDNIVLLQYSEIDTDAKPDPEKEPAITISYTMKDGSSKVLTFIEKEPNLYYLMRDGQYAGVTVRLNMFSAATGIIDSYEALKLML